MKRASETKPFGIHWFRRDLRVSGNQALQENAKRTEGRTLGLFCFDSSFLSRDDFSHNRFAFFLKTMEKLREELRANGGDLLVVDKQPLEAFETLLKFCESKLGAKPSLVTFSRDYEPFARDRDEKVSAYLQKEKVETFVHRDHLLFEPHEVVRADGPDGFYKVYGPWSKKWFNLMNSDEGQNRILAIAKPKKMRDFSLTWSSLAGPNKLPYSDAYDSFIKANNKHVDIEIPEAGFEAGLRELRSFRPKVKAYLKDRDYPAAQATTKLSMFMKNGSLTIAHQLHELNLSHCKFGDQDGPSKFARELAWRDFYYSILYFRPDVEKGAFQTRYNKVKWNDDEALFRRWQEGQTGVPIVDAGMRELKETGWITNRVRIIVSSFLIKDLLINWQWGERHFMNLLLDGDLAPNNGNWQWAASTGADPNPYFRILSPWSQGKKFDPEGDYIRQWVPELRKAPADVMHEPKADRSKWGYALPIVDHSVQRLKAIEMFKKLSTNPGRA